MDINLKVTIESPVLVEVLKGLVEAVQSSGKSVSEIETVEVIKNEVEVVMTAPLITIEEVRASLAKLSQSGKQKEVKALIEKYGAKKLTDIEASQYSDLMKEAEGL